MAATRHRSNIITQLVQSDGTILTDPALKANALCFSFKDRLGISEHPTMILDLAWLVQQVPLPIMDDPFSEDEIKTALTDMPSDHALGPDGFNGAYMKKC